MVIQMQNDPWGNLISGFGSTLGSALQQAGQVRRQEAQAKQKEAQQARSDIWNRLFQQGKELGLAPESMLNIGNNAFAIQQQYGLDPNSALLAALSQSEGSNIFPLTQQQPGQMTGAMGQQGQIPSQAQAQPGLKPPTLRQVLEKIPNPISTFLKNPALEPARRGVESGIGGRAAAALQGEGEKAFQERTGVREGENIFSRTLHSAGQIGADLPFYLGGGAAGTALGGPVGGAVASFALPGMLRTALSEYQQYLDNGGKGSFERFLTSAGNVAQAGLEEGSKGLIFGSLGQLTPILKQIPGMNKVLSMKKAGAPLEKALTGTLQAAGILGTDIAAKQQLPSKQDVLDTFVQTIGLNFAHLPQKGQERIVEKIQKSGIAPTEFSERVSEEITKGGKEFETIKEKIESGENEKFSTKEQKKLNDLVNRISKQPPKLEDITTERVAQETRPGQQFEVQKIKEEQIERAKKSPKVIEEILEEEERRETDRAKEAGRNKRPETIEKETAIKEKAKQELPILEENVRETRAAMGRAADELTFAKMQGLPKDQIAQLQQNYNRLKVNYDDAVSLRDQSRKASQTGKIYETEKDLRQRAFNRGEEIYKEGEKVLEKSPVEKKLKEAWEKIKDRKDIPGQEKILMDQFRKAKNAYLAEYQKILNSINNYLKNPGLSEAQAATLRNRKAIFENLIKDLKSYEKVGSRRQALRMTGEAIRKQLRGRVSQEAAGSKVQAREFFKEFKPSEENIQKESENIAKEAENIIKESAKESERKSEAPKTEKEKAQKTSTGSLGAGSSPSYLLSNIIRNSIKKRFGINVPQGAIYPLVSVVLTSAGIGGVPSLTKKVSDLFRSLKAAGMSEQQRQKYTNDLIRNGMPKKRVNNIRKQSQYLNRKFS